MRKNLIDLHSHSVLSLHAYSSFTENIEYANSIGLEYYGISEHQPDNVGVGAHKYAFHNVVRIRPKNYKGTNVLVGVELNILDNGFDLTGFDPYKLDYCIASMHGYVYSAKDHSKLDNTRNYINALKTDYVTMLGHLDYPSYPCDYEAIIKTAKDYDRIIELNNASLDPNGSRAGAKQIDYEILKYCVEYKVPILMGSDAHIKYEIGNVDFCQALLEEIDFPEELVLNYNRQLFNHYFVK